MGLVVQRKQDLEESIEQWDTFVAQLERLVGELNERDSLLKDTGKNFHVISEEAAEQKIAEYRVGF